MDATHIVIQAPTEAHGFADGPIDNDTSSVANVDNDANVVYHNDPFSTPTSSHPPSIRSRYLASSSNNDTTRSSADISLPSLASRPPVGSSTSVVPSGRVRGRMKSHMITDHSNVPKPWLENKRPRDKIAYWIVYLLVFIGIAAGAIQSYFAYTTVLLDREPLCLLMEENFDSEDAVFGPSGSFFREVSMDGFGNGQFEMATDSRNNSYIHDGKLYIVPTLTSDDIGTDALYDGTVYNITGCTFNETRPNNGFLIQDDGTQVFDQAGYVKACSAVSNITTGSIINPVQSARLTTKGRHSLRYGRVEIRAKLPVGDWMWPAIWMLPTDNVYGAWPLSGEIDIVESRGNGIKYTARGANYVQGSLNWGPLQMLNGVSKTYSWWTNKRVPFSSDFHTYTLEWTHNFLRIYVDTRLHTLLELKFDQPFFERGDFPQVVYDKGSPTALQNPWINGTNATPFDQEFYLILNVAVGGTNGWFPESQGDKPWLDNAANPMRDFAKAISQWYPTWPSNADERAMVVDYVKMWKHCNEQG